MILFPSKMKIEHKFICSEKKCMQLHRECGEATKELLNVAAEREVHYICYLIQSYSNKVSPALFLST